MHHWADGGDTSLENLALLCTHHHRLLHEGGFKIEREGEGALRFLRADGRAIPRCGYRLDDFMDDGDQDPSREGFCTAVVHQPRDEVRERVALYHVRRIGLAPAC